MTSREAAERLRQERQQSRDRAYREALQMAEQALVTQDRHTQALRHWQAWAQRGAEQ